jgi:hemoglobin
VSSDKKDILSREDITRLVDAFYDRVLKDDQLAPHFAGLDFEHHKPKMVAFWSFVLLNESGYTTNVFDKHIHLKIDKHHFDQWAALFHSTVDGLFAGENADATKQRASVLAWTFSEKMKRLREE